MKLLFLLFLLTIELAFGSQTYYYDGEKRVELRPIQTLLRSNVDTNAGVDFYALDSGATVGVSDAILVWFESDKNIEHYMSEFDAVIHKQIDEHLYLLKVSDKSKSIETANALHQKEDVRFAHPDFLHSRELR